VILPGFVAGSPFAVAGHAFAGLLGPVDPGLRAKAAGLLPSPVGEWTYLGLRTAVLRPGVPRWVRDVVWRELVWAARRPGCGQIAAVGVALPGLRVAAGRLRCRWPGQRPDLEGELLTGFLARIQDRQFEVGAPRVCGRLIDAAVRAAQAAAPPGMDSGWVRAACVDGGRPLWPWGHPDWVLGKAVVAGVLDAHEAWVIGATRLEGVPLAQVAVSIGVHPDLAARWRRRAECRLREAIGTGQLEVVWAAGSRVGPCWVGAVGVGYPTRDLL
jgi:hypothetical protein